MKVEEQKLSKEQIKYSKYKDKDLAQVEVKEAESYEKLDLVLDEYEDDKGALITVLHRAQKIFGHLPREVQIYVAERLGLSFAEVYGVVSFYSLFNVEPRGEHTVEVCLGTACYVKGAQKILHKLKKELGIDPGEISEDGKFTTETTRCLGACSLAPIVKIGDDVHGNITADDVSDILKNIVERSEDFD